jgi:hypothetical protein
VALSGSYEIVAISTDKNTFFNDLKNVLHSSLIFNLDIFGAKNNKIFDPIVLGGLKLA